MSRPDPATAGRPASSLSILRLSARAARRLDWCWQSISIAGAPRWVATPADPQHWLIEACRQEQQASVPETIIDPFWAQVWESCAALDRQLGAQPPSGLQVLELGCGCGAAGLAAALRGAVVTFTDGVSTPLLLVQLTLARHRLAGCVTGRLRFGIDQLPHRFPLIIASDVTYQRSSHAALLRTLAVQLAPGGQVLLSDPCRPITDAFIAAAQADRWRVEQQPDDGPATARVLRLSRADILAGHH